MKFCAVCGKSYESPQQFCHSDGSLLNEAVNDFAASTEIKSSARLIYPSVGILALVLCGGIFSWFWMRTDSQIRAETYTKNSVVENENTISSNRAPNGKNTNVLTTETVQNLIERWEKAQDSRAFESYRNCYARTFKGVKTMLKGSQEFNYEQWMKDRRLMFGKAVGLDVDVKNLQISVDGETATAEFDQYYRSLSYSDWGRKVLKIEQTPDGAKITYELMKQSNPF